MNCPKCGALNPEEAQWCGQCFARFGEKPPETEVVHPDARSDPATSPASQLRVLGKEGRLLEEGGRLFWKCSACERVNPMESDVCSACGSSLYRMFGEASPKTQPTERDPASAALLSLLPGIGHLWLGETAEGIVRICLTVWWFGSALFLRQIATLRWMAYLFFAAWLGLIVVTVLDAYRIAQDRGTRQILQRKLVFYVSLALVGISVFGSTAAFLSVSR